MFDILFTYIGPVKWVKPKDEKKSSVKELTDIEALVDVYAASPLWPYSQGSKGEMHSVHHPHRSGLLRYPTPPSQAGHVGMADAGV